MDFVRILPLVRAIVYSWFAMFGLLLTGVVILGWKHPRIGIVLIAIAIICILWKLYSQIRLRGEARRIFRGMGLESK